MVAHSSALLRRPGAVDAPDNSPDHGVPFHYGDPFGEQRAATSGPVVVDRSHRDTLVITGEERLTWLDGFVSQHVAGLEPGQATEMLVLDPNGRIEHHACVAETGDRLILDTEAGRGAELAGFLRKMVFWAKVEIMGGEGAAEAGDAGADGAAGGDLAVLTLAGTSLPASITTPGGASVTLPAEAGTCANLTDGAAARRQQWPGDGSVDLLVPRAELEAWFDAAVEAGARPAGSWAFEALRAGDEGDPTRLIHARIGVDTDEKAIPHEVPAWIGGLEVGGAVHLDKGCYRGQETVSRVHNLGKSPRVLVRLQLDGSGDTVPETGAAVTAGGRTVGRVGTVVQHFEYGPIALALVKRAVKAGVELEIDGVAAQVDPATAPADTGPQAGREAVKRLRGG